jgi:hypothetical protein
VGLFEGLLLAAVAIGRSVDPRIGVRLQAATRFLAAERAYKPSAGELELADAALEEARAALGGVTFADEWSRGEQLDLDAAVATALQSLD